ncbi:hypothetical protein MKW94_025980 [Papaver nudicaule]|uniref:RRM domain-containing protein n=1 Tax=Papaver nudicaule TaxID=74823 RepID=A0AA41VGZ9_PAPNU|nr:hypothetical protein [Papaver nudicaule]
MAFASKLGGLVRQSLSVNSPSMYNAVRCMSGSKLFIGGLSYNTDENQLREAFGTFGEITHARVITDRETGRSRGFGFVSYTSDENASAALDSMDGQDLGGRNIRVSYANERAPRPAGGGYSGGDGYSGGGGYNNSGGGGY